MIMIVCDKTYPLQKVTSITKSKKGIPKYLPRPIHLHSIKLYVSGNGNVNCLTIRFGSDYSNDVRIITKSETRTLPDCQL